MPENTLVDEKSNFNLAGVLSELPNVLTPRIHILPLRTVCISQITAAETLQNGLVKSNKHEPVSTLLEHHQHALVRI